MIRKSLLILFSAAFLFEGCAVSPDPKTLDRTEQASLGWNSLGWNSLGWNSLGWNSLGWNSLGWNSLGWNGLGWTGTGFSNTSIAPDWGLDTWVNHTDANSVGGITSDDRDIRLKGVEYWVGCACGSADFLALKIDNPYTAGPHPNSELHTFQGNFGLAPTWCTGTGSVPVSEMQAVSACLVARVNDFGIHNAISVRGYQSSLQLGQNEKMFMAYPEGQFFGNLWDTASELYDASENNYYPNAAMNACYYPWAQGNSQFAHDLQLLVGRTCEWDGCGGPVRTTGSCFDDGTVDGSYSTGHDAAMNPVTTADPAVGSSGLNNSSANGYQDNLTGQQFATWHNNSWAKLSTFLGDWADLEVENWKDVGYQCSTACPQSDSCRCYKNYCLEGEGGTPATCEYPSACNICATVIAPLTKGPMLGKSAACEPAEACVRGRKLTGLPSGYWLRIQFMKPYDLLSGSYVTGVANPHKAGTVQFRYSNGAAAVSSILIKDLIRNTLIDGTGFVTTPAGWDDYQNHAIYPVYPGRSSFSGATPGMDLAIAMDPASPVFPNLDYVQMWVGPPYNVQPREQYDDHGKWGDAIPEGKDLYVSSQVSVGDDGFKSDFAQAHQVRIQVNVTHPNVKELKIRVSHGENAVTISGGSLDASGWSGWLKNFAQDNPGNGPWQVQVYDPVVNGSKGTLNAVSVEFMQ